MLWPTVSRPLCLGVEPHLRPNTTFLLLLQLMFCWCGAPSLKSSPRQPSVTWYFLGHCLAMGMFARPFPSECCLCWSHNSGFQQTRHNIEEFICKRVSCLQIKSKNPSSQMISFISWLLYENLQTKIAKTAHLPVVWHSIKLGLLPKETNLNRYCLGTNYWRENLVKKERVGKRIIEKFV
jgi:hypothetical protein